MKQTLSKLTGMILACAMLSLLIVPQAAATFFNLAPNPDFETAAESGGGPQSWGLNSGSWDTSYVTEGTNHYIHISGGQTASTSYLSVTPNTTYKFAVDYKSSVSSENGSSSFVYIYQYTDSGAASRASVTYSLPNTKGVWTHLETDYTSSADTTRVAIHLRSRADVADDTLCYDNVVFGECDAAGISHGNLGMENLTNGFPATFTIESGTATLETTTVYSGSNAIKLQNTNTDATTAVVVPISLPYFRIPYHYEVGIRFKLENVDDAAAGLRFTSFTCPNNTETIGYLPGHSKSGGQTGYFKDDTYAYFRKAMTFFPAGHSITFLRAELAGIATAYIDEITVEAVPYIVNGGFEGLYSDRVPTGWLDFVDATKKWVTDPTDTTSNGHRLIESATGNYVRNSLAYTAPGLRQNLTAATFDFTAGQTFKVSADFKDEANWGLGVTFDAGMTTNGTYWSSSSDNTWQQKAVYGTYKSGTLAVRFVNRAAATAACFDNCAISVVEDAVNFVKDGTEITAIAPGTITVNYTRPETDYANPTTVTMITAVYKMNDGVKTLENIYFDTDTAVLVTATGSTGKYTGDEPATGYRPVLISRDVTIGNTGTYSINTLFWDGMSTLKPLRSNVQLGN